MEYFGIRSLDDIADLDNLDDETQCKITDLKSLDDDIMQLIYITSMYYLAYFP